MDGTLTVEDGSLYDFLELLGANLVDRDFSGLDRWLIRTGSLWRRFAQINPLARAQANADDHYDLSDSPYDLFLDRDRQYSCAYFASPGASLEVAQILIAKSADAVPFTRDFIVDCERAQTPLPRIAGRRRLQSVG